MLRYAAAVAALALVAVLGHHRPPALPPEASVQGEVTLDGVPLARGLLVMEGGWWASVTVVDGRFELPLAAVGPVRFTVFTPVPGGPRPDRPGTREERYPLR